MPPAHVQADDAASTPVFVDDSGRRHRMVRVVGWCLGSVMVGYLALLGISLVGSPGLVPLSLPSLGRVLPGPAAPLIADPSHSPTSTGDLVATASPASPSATPPALSPVVSPAATTSRRRSTPRPQPTATHRPTATPTATATPAQPARPTQRSTSHPTHKPSTHPSPHSTAQSTPIASPTPTASAT